MLVSRIAPAALILLLGACGSGDPTPEADEAASAPEINMAVEHARSVAAHAGLPDTPEGEDALARRLIAPAKTPHDANSAATPSATAAMDDASLAFAAP